MMKEKAKRLITNQRGIIPEVTGTIVKAFEEAEDDLREEEVRSMVLDAAIILSGFAIILSLIFVGLTLHAGVVLAINARLVISFVEETINPE